jgi:hypothetical protein
MSKRILIGMAALGALAAIGLATAAHGRPARTTVVVHARSQLEHVQFVDNGPKGSSPGDQLIFTERLLDAAGHQVGSDAADCTSLFDARSLCTGTYILRGGQVMVQLVQPGPTGVYTQAITGGTGRYGRATGTVTVDQRPTGDRFTLRIHTSAR